MPTFVLQNSGLRNVKQYGKGGGFRMEDMAHVLSHDRDGMPHVITEPLMKSLISGLSCSGVKTAKDGKTFSALVLVRANMFARAFDPSSYSHLMLLTQNISPNPL